MDEEERENIQRAIIDNEEQVERLEQARKNKVRAIRKRDCTNTTAIERANDNFGSKSKSKST